MSLHLSSAASGYSGPPDTQADILREMARKRASDETWNMVHTGMMAAQLASMNNIHSQMEQVKRQNEDALAIQQELLNREQLQQYLEEFIFQTEKLVQRFSAKSDVPASTRYFLLQSVLAQVEQDGIDTATIRGRDNKAAFEQTMTRVHRLVAMLLKDAEVQDAIRWAEKQEAARLAKQQKIDDELNRLYEQRMAIEADKNPASYANAFNFMASRLKENMPAWGWIALIPASALAIVLVVPLFLFGGVAVFAIHLKRQELNEEANSPLDYQLSVIDKRIAAVQAEAE